MKKMSEILDWNLTGRRDDQYHMQYQRRLEFWYGRSPVPEWKAVRWDK